MKSYAMPSYDRFSLGGSSVIVECPTASDASPRSIGRVRERTDSATESFAGRLYLYVKPVGDFVAALFLLVLFLPVIAIAALATRLGSSGPAFYWQTRLGRDGRPFRICKIRTMVHNAEAKTGAVWSPRHDSRITPLGRFLRRSHIDEFPQLLHVLSGHMSLVGPRPERPEFVERLQWEVPNYRERLRVKPGVTGLAQLMLPPDADIDDVRRKVQCDLYYIQRCNLWLDLIIGMHTAWLLATAVALAIFAPFRLPACRDVEELAQEREQMKHPESLPLGADLA